MVDVDEADIAVLNQNLIKSKELFNSISKSLTTISTKSTNASTRIKPILKDVNKLTNDNKQIERGIETLQEVSGYAERASNYETILSTSIDVIGVKKYIDTLNKLRVLLMEMKSKIKKFLGILINFENLIDKSELNLVNYFKKQIVNNKFSDIMLVMHYFQSDNKQINKILVDSRSAKMVEKMKSIEKSVEFKPKPMGPSNPPYEKGSNGLNVYLVELIDLLAKEMELLEKLESTRLFNMIIDHTMDNFNDVLEKNYISFFNDSNLILNDILILEIIEILNNFIERFNAYENIKNFKVNLTITKLINIIKNFPKEFFKYIEQKILTIDKMNELNQTGIVVELITKLRKQSDFPNGLNRIIEYYKLGDWLNIKPSLRFISVYTSVIKNDNITNNVSNYCSDLIDCIMINMEISLKEFKKSTQGYYLMKDMILLETMVNRSQNLFDILGSTGLERINKLKKRFLNLFLEDWNHASYLIIKEMTEINALVAMNQKDKEKDLIKKVFERFNEAFDEACKNYEKFNINDPNLKNYLNSEIKKLILNSYFKLYDKYGDNLRSKKYVRYNKLEFENIVNDRLK